MKKTIYTLVGLCSLSLSACNAPSQDQAVIYLKSGDELLSCDAIGQEIKDNERGIARFLPDTLAKDKQQVLSQPGAFLVVPWFLTGPKNENRFDIIALRQRNSALRELANQKECSLPPPNILFEEKPKDPSAQLYNTVPVQ